MTVIMLDSDFPHSNAGLDVPNGVTGVSWVDTIYQMADNSSTRKPYLDSLVAPQVNPFWLIRGGGKSATAGVDDVLFKDFQIQGPSLGHPFNGLFLGSGKRGKCENLWIANVQGQLNGPPEETGLIGVWRQENFVLNNCVLDGRNVFTGVPIASSPLMLNFCKGGVMNGGWIGYAAFGFQAAMWQMEPGPLGETYEFNDVVFPNGSRRCLNIEQALPNAVFNFNRCTFPTSMTGGDYICQISTTNHGRAFLNINDPVGSPNLKVRTYPPSANGGLNGMLESDIKYTIGGVDVTSSKLTFEHVGW